ncbi:MAG: hypothetical protein AAFP19_02880 [Bacteroidota bacterium]
MCAHKAILPLLGLFLCYGLSISAQISLKAYSHFHYLNAELHPQPYDFEPRPFRHRGFSGAIRWANSASTAYHELNGEIRFRDFEGIESEEYSLRYEYGIYFKKIGTPALRFSLSGAGRIYYLYEEVEASQSLSGFRVRVDQAGLNWAIFLRMEYFFWENWFIDVNLTALNIYYGVDFSRVFNPLLTTRQQRQGGLETGGARYRLLRIGFGYQF